MSKATKGKKSNKPTGPNCLICCEIWRKGENAIKCKTCKNLLHGQDSEDEDEFRNNINSRYYDIDEFNTKTKHDLNSSLRIGHTNIASISKHIDDLHIPLSMLKVNFHIIGITDHKIQNKIDPIVNLDLEGF